MNKITIMDSKGRIISTIESNFVPNVGEVIWLDNGTSVPDARKVNSRIIDLDNIRKKLNVTIVLED